MKAILHFLDRERWWPLWAILIGALVLLPGLGASGFWEPHEIQIADSARARYAAPDQPDTTDPSTAGKPATGQSRPGPKPGQAGKTPEAKGPPLTEWSIARGMDLASSHRDFGARLPLALLGLAALAATFFLGRRMAGSRAGLLAALVLVSFPLFLVQSRQLMSDIGAVTGSAFIALGTVGLVWPGKDRPIWLYAVDLALVAAGAVLSYYAAALLLGVLVPFAAVALASLAGLVRRLPETASKEPHPRAWHPARTSTARCSAPAPSRASWRWPPLPRTSTAGVWPWPPCFAPWLPALP